MDSNPFNPAAQGGVPDFLVPNPPPETPEPQEMQTAGPTASPFREALDIDQIKANLVLDRPLKLFIPNMHRYPEYEFRIINNIPTEVADATNKGFRIVDDPEMTKLFTDLVAGTDKDGKAYRPILVARPKVIGEHIRERNRKMLKSIYAGMDPKNKTFESKYAENEGSVTKGQFEGPAFRIRTRK